MQTNDRREEWMGLGIILTEIRFRTWVEKRADARWGYRVRRRICWRSLFKTGTGSQLQCVKIFLTPFGIELKEKYEEREEIEKWFHLLNRQWSEAITDRAGLNMMEWVTANPIPRKSANDADFLNWIESFDNEKEMLENAFGI